MDSYLSRFEKYAVANKWDRSIWAAYLSALLKGRALEVYDRLSVADANDYEKLKDALLKNFDMTERGFRKKFRNDNLKGLRPLFSSVVDCAAIWINGLIWLRLRTRSRLYAISWRVTNF